MDENVSLRPGVRAVIEDEGALLLDLWAGQYFSLNDLGARIWSHLEAGLGRAEILDRMAPEPGPARQVLALDLDSFVCSLADRGLIHVHA